MANESVESKAPVQPITVGDKLTEMFGLDVRSLALFRIGLGLVIIADLINRMSDLTAFYTDDGVLPRDFLPTNSAISIHALHGSAWFQLLLFGVAIGFALMLIVGWKTRVATLVSWFLLLSLQARNIAIQHNGDLVLRFMLLWGIFLPLGACYSIDARSSPRPKDASPTIISAGTIAYFLQVIIVYWFAVLWKYGPEWTTERTAVFYAVHLEPHTRTLGYWIRDYPALMKFLTHVTMIVEGVGPALLIFPFFTQWCRILTVLLFLGLHTGFALFLVLGNFNWVCYVAWIVFLPPLFWSWMGRWFHNPALEGLTLYYDKSNPRSRGRVGLLWAVVLFYQSQFKSFEGSQAGQRRRQEGDEWFVVDGDGNEHRGLDAVIHTLSLSPLYWPLARMLQWSWLRGLAERRYARSANKPVPEQSEPPPTWHQIAWKHASSPTVALVAFFLIGFIFLWNVRTVEHRLPLSVQQEFEKMQPRQMNNLGYSLGLSQGWGVFAPMPGKRHGWYLYYAKLQDDSRVFLKFNGHKLEATVVQDNLEQLEAKPERVSDTYINSRWCSYLQNLPQPAYASIRGCFALYLVRCWNRDHPENPAVTMEIYLKQQETTLDGFTVPEKRILYRYAVLPHQNPKLTE